MTRPLCDACGEPAVSMARDIRRVERPDTDYATYEPVGRIKAGCALHPVHSVEHLHREGPGEYMARKARK